MDKYQALAEVLEILRDGRTQASVAEKAGIPASSWCLYEKGKRYPEKNMPKVAKALGVTEAELLDLIHRRRFANLEQQHEQSRTEAALSEDISAIPEEIRHALHHCWRAFQEFVVRLYLHNQPPRR